MSLQLFVGADYKRNGSILTVARNSSSAIQIFLSKS